jgi:hypothetical protein
MLKKANQVRNNRNVKKLRPHYVTGNDSNWDTSKKHLPTLARVSERKEQETQKLQIHETSEVRKCGHLDVHRVAVLTIKGDIWCHWTRKTRRYGGDMKRQL